MEPPTIVEGFNGNTAKVIGIDSVRVSLYSNSRGSNTAMLQGVLHVPDVNKNLLSTTAAAKSGMATTFDINRATITKSGQTIATAVRYQEHMGVAERKNRTLMNAARAMLDFAGLPDRFWAEAVAYVNHINNCVPSKSLSGASPNFIWDQKVPDVSQLHTFRCKVQVLNKGPLQHKLGKRTYGGIYLRLSYESSGHQIFRTETGRLVISRNVTFFKVSLTNIVLSTPKRDDTHQDTDSDSESEGKEQTTTLPIVPPTPPTVFGLGKDNITPEPPEEVSTTLMIKVSPNTEATVSPVVSSKNTPTTTVRQSTRTSKPPQWFRDYANTATAIVEPRSYKEAMKSPLSVDWFKAMEKEVKAQEDNDTYILVPRPTNKPVLPQKWVLKAKKDGNGQLERLKARLVAMSNNQTKGIDFEETYAPVARMQNIRILLTIATAEGSEI